jgi:hypothetical protein
MTGSFSGVDPLSTLPSTLSTLPPTLSTATFLYISTPGSVFLLTPSQERICQNVTCECSMLRRFTHSLCFTLLYIVQNTNNFMVFQYVSLCFIVFLLAEFYCCAAFENSHVCEIWQVPSTYS